MDRRQFLFGTLLTASSVPFTNPCWGFSAKTHVSIARLRHGGNWNVHPEAASVLAREMHMRTSIDMTLQEEDIYLDSPRLAALPFAVLCGDQEFSFTEAQRLSLKRWLELGGFLLVDNSGHNRLATGFDHAVRLELKKLFPREQFERVSPNHVIFRSFYRLDYPAGRVIRRPYVEGLSIGRRYAVIVCHNDLLGAYAQGRHGRFLHRPNPGGENQREFAIRFGVNLMMYGLCLHYKDDQVHLDYLLHRRKWKIRPPD
jgi:hypothetical protein